MVIGRIVISDVEPVVDCGHRQAKAVAGETFEVSATVFREGHEALGSRRWSCAGLMASVLS